MRIVIEVNGQTVTAIGPNDAPAALGSPVPMVGDAPPGPAPEGLLARAKKLGALSAGAAQFDCGAALTTPATVPEPRVRAPKKARRTRR